MSRSLIRRQLLDFEPYSPGLSIEEIKKRYGLSSVIKLASNENALGASPKALQALDLLREERDLRNRQLAIPLPELTQMLLLLCGLLREEG